MKTGMMIILWIQVVVVMGNTEKISIVWRCEEVKLIWFGEQLNVGDEGEDTVLKVSLRFWVVQLDGEPCH